MNTNNLRTMSLYMGYLGQYLEIDGGYPISLNSEIDEGYSPSLTLSTQSNEMGQSPDAIEP